MNILLAEDNEANRLLVQSLLERAGHSVSCAENGQAALEICLTQKFDLVLMDILMPVMDGVKALRRLRRSGGRNSGTPVFALTAYSSADDRQRYRQVGFDLVLKKPLMPGDIEKAWNQHLKGGASPEIVPLEKPPQNFKNIELLNPIMMEQLLQAGSPQAVTHIIERFRESARLKRSEIQTHLFCAQNGKNHDLTILRRAAHAVKGAAATLGLARVSHIAAQLQNAPPDSLSGLITQLDRALARSEEALDYFMRMKLPKTGSAVARSSDVDAQRA